MIGKFWVPAAPVLLAILIGTAGGALFNHFQMPLAWMIGSMIFTAAAGMANVRMSIPKHLRTAMIMILGIMLGSSFTPEILPRLGEWAWSLLTLPLYIAMATGVGILVLRRFSSLDRVTAFFTSVPGGLSEMVLAGSEMGGNGRHIALYHSLRIMMVVILISAGYQWLGLYDPQNRGVLGPSLDAVTPFEMLILAACVIGFPIARLLRIPAAAIVGPMVASAILHLAGVTDGKPPALFVATAQVVIGASLGCRFVGASVREIGFHAIRAGWLTLLLLGVTGIVALTVDTATGLGLAALILAFAPGGLAEMSLIAMALHADVALVATHHIVRIVLIVTLVPTLFMLWQRHSKPGDRP